MYWREELALDFGLKAEKNCRNNFKILWVVENHCYNIAVDRLLPSIPFDQILILTHVDYKSLIQEQLPNFKESQIILEPHMRNTAPCLLFTSLKIQK